MRFAKQIFRKIDQQANTCAEIDSTDLLIENEDKESDADEPNVDDELKKQFLGRVKIMVE